MLVLKVLKGQEKRDRVCACREESRLWSTKEDCCPCLRKRLHALMGQHPSVLYPSGSAHLYSFPEKFSISPPFAPYTIHHPQQILYFRMTSTFSHPMDLLCWLLSENCSVVFVPFYYKSTGRANAVLQIQSCQTGETTSYQALSESTLVCPANHICLASGGWKANIASLFIISSRTTSSLTSGPKLPGSADFLILTLPKGGCLCPTAQPPDSSPGYFLLPSST